LNELDKNPSYHKQIENVIQGKTLASPPDTVNLQDESPTIVFGPHIDEQEDSIAPFVMSPFLGSPFL